MGSTEKTPLHKKDGEEGGPKFASTLGLICTCMGTAVGTGNVWRYPRVVAASSGEDGALCFIIVWLLFLVIWSIPMLVIEYGLGRYTHSAVTHSFMKFIGTRFSLCGFFITAVQFAIGAYYTVILGWCIYYSFYFMVHPLPVDFANGTAIFTTFAQDSNWPVLTQAIGILLTGIILLKGVSTIEKANLFLAPALLTILFSFFVWSCTRTNATAGLKFMFSPDWNTLKDPFLWIEAASQNAFDTGAGTGVFVCYAAFMGRRDPAVKLSMGIPLLNNLVSLLCGMMIFSTVFASLTQENPNITRSEILDVLQSSGPGSTGLTFIWLPVLLQTAGTTGRVMVVLFFLCLIFAALSSNLALQEIVVHLLEDFGLDRKFGVPITMGLCFVIGIGSALNLDYLTNQDFTWGFALVINGLMLLALVIIFGVSTFRTKIVVEYGIGDFYLPRVWEFLIKYTSPILGVGLLVWWIIDNIANDDENKYAWYTFAPESLIGVLLQWILLLILATAATIILECIKPKWYDVVQIDPDNLVIPPDDGEEILPEPKGSINQSYQPDAGVVNENSIELKES